MEGDVVVVVAVEVEARADEPPPRDGGGGGAGGLALEPRAVAATVHGDDERGCGLRDCGARRDGCGGTAKGRREGRSGCAMRVYMGGGDWCGRWVVLGIWGEKNNNKFLGLSDHALTSFFMVG